MKTLLIIPLLLLSAMLANAQQYSNSWYKIAGGGGTSSGGTFQVTGTIGQPEAGATMNGGGYSLTGGFWSMISVVQSTGGPLLTISRSINSVVISWPSPSTGFVLEQTSNPGPGNWSPANGFAESDDGTNRSITITAPAGNLIFRLSHP